MCSRGSHRGNHIDASSREDMGRSEAMALGIFGKGVNFTTKKLSHLAFGSKSLFKILFTEIII